MEMEMKEVLASIKRREETQLQSLSRLRWDLAKPVEKKNRTGTQDRCAEQRQQSGSSIPSRACNDPQPLLEEAQDIRTDGLRGRQALLPKRKEKALRILNGDMVGGAEAERHPVRCQVSC